MSLSRELVAQGVALSTGVMLVTAVLQVWRRSLVASVRLLAVQGFALASLVALLGVAERETAVVAMALGIAALKGALVPRLLLSAVRAGAHRHEEPSRVHAAAGLLAAAALVVVAFAASRPLASVAEGASGRALPFGMALVLLGLLLMATRHRAVGQLVGFVVLDNGIGAVAYLAAGGVPLLVELGVTFDVLLVLVILRVLTARMRTAYGRTDLDDLAALKD